MAVLLKHIKAYNALFRKAVGGDPFIADVKLLMHFNGNFTPSIGTATFAADGTNFTSVNAKFDQSVNIGGNSPGGGGSNVVYSSGGTADLDINSVDFTAEGWIMQNTGATRPRTLIRFDTPSNDLIFTLVSDGPNPGQWTAAFPDTSSTTQYIGGSNNVPGTWTYLALTRHVNDYRFFINGVYIGAFTTAFRPGAGPPNVYIGNSGRAFVDALDGLIDEIRITVGVARYITSFTPPSAPFPDY